jgi:hypothetical protein
MATGFGWTIGRSHKDDIFLGTGLLRSCRCARTLTTFYVIGALFLRLSCVFQVDVSRLDAEAILIVQASGSTII